MMTYNVVKSLHIISIIAWMAGLLYLPRLFVYHSQLSAGSDARSTFETMERRLLKAIMLPAMLASWAFGIWLATLLGAWAQGWLNAKLLLVLILSGMHGFLAREARRLAQGGQPRPTKFYRMINEVPTLILIGAVFLVVLKPF
ncbi:putative membrane protein [Rhizobiales bacterium GAS191]|jgi:putative membrane protein|nr:putative membrane protein [Rhizobiales bacterium GAS113]SEC13998.1 putative membrane protein [Rhizobiales bacterium GAS191]SED06769.1 putative membrane protein [Rhizobiales bacterium GAS188]